MGDRTAVAVCLSGGAHVSSMEEKPVMGETQLFFRDITTETLLYLQRGVVAIVDQSYAMTDPINMSIYRHGTLSESHRKHHVGCLASYARQRDEFVESLRHNRVEALH